MGTLDYTGRQQFSRDRNLTEPDVLQPKILDEDIEVSEAEKQATAIFSSLGRTYLKGQALLKGIAAMSPAQFIPVGDTEGAVTASARRVDDSSTKIGTIIPFAVYTKCVDLLAKDQWNAKRIYDKVSLPDEVIISHQSVTELNSTSENLISKFFSGDGLAGTILMAMAIAPMQIPGFSALGVEQGTKAYFLTQVPLGIAILIELGYKARAIIDLLKQSGHISPQVEEIAVELDTNIEARREALGSAGIDYEDLVESQSASDAKTILDYCHRYMSTFTETDTLSYDHWIAYGNVHARQNIVRAALDSATKYSKTFAVMFDRDTPIPEAQVTGVVNASVQHKPQLDISDAVASHFVDMTVTTGGMYNDIARSLLYQATDADLCCLVEIFGEVDASVLTSIAGVLRILALDMRNVSLLMINGFMNALTNLAYPALYEMIAQLDQLYNKVGQNLDQALVSALPHFEHCPSMKDISIALRMSLGNIKHRIDRLLADLLTVIDNIGRPEQGTWKIAADRRFIMTTAKVLDVLAFRIDAAQVCAQKQDNYVSADKVIADAKDAAAGEIIHTILDNSPYSLQISDNDLEKYFPDLDREKSHNFEFTYGPNLSSSVISEGVAQTSCGDSTADLAMSARVEFVKALSEAFGNNG